MDGRAQISGILEITYFLLQIVAKSLQVISNSAMSVSVDWIVDCVNVSLLEYIYCVRVSRLL